MDIIWIVLGSLCMVIGLIGCLLPVVPGPPISYLGLLLLQLTDNTPFSTQFMIIWLGITVVVVVLDYLIPAFGTKKYGGSRWGILGTMVGLLIGIFVFPPFGIIIGPIVGALIGEALSGKSSEQAMRAAFGSFVGFLFGTLIKLTASSIMIYYFIAALW